MSDPSDRRLRVGVIGAGSWARQAHVPAFTTCPGVELVAICDVDRPRAERVAREAGIPRAYASVGEMLDRERPDLVSVVTPDDCHRAAAEAAIAAGAHVLCEKPLATSLADAQVLAAAAAAAGVRTKVGFVLRFAPAVMRLRELVAAGAIGTPQVVQAFQQNGQFLDPTAPLHWKMRRERTGGGAVVEYGIHTLDLVSWIAGEVGRVCATSRTWLPERPLPDGTGVAPVEVDDSTAWLMEFASGAIGVGHAGWATVGRPPGLELRVFGSGGAVRCVLADDLPGDEALWMAGPDGSFRSAEVPSRLSAAVPASGPWWYRLTAHLVWRFVAEIIDGAEAAGPTFADGVRAQAILEALLAAAGDGRWVTVKRGGGDR